MRRGAIVRVLSVLLVLFGMPVMACAQGEDESLGVLLRKSFGFAAGARIQGRFKLTARGPDDLVRVEFFVDDERIQSVAQPPFEISFHTAEYSPGQHTIQAIGYTQAGGTLSSPEYTYQFLSADEAQSSALRIVGPLLIAVALLSILAGVIPTLLGRGKNTFELGVYGAAGGAICPRCRLPYSRHYFSPNLLVGKLERCPHCGKWAIVRAAYGPQLQMAEDRYQVEQAQGGMQVEEEEEGRLRRMIDDSRFEG